MSQRYSHRQRAAKGCRPLKGIFRKAMKETDCCHCEGIAQTRRDFLRVGTLSLLGVSVSDLLRFGNAQMLAATAQGAAAPRAKAQAVILIWLEGGISHVDSWDV